MIRTYTKLLAKPHIISCARLSMSTAEKGGEIKVEEAQLGQNAHPTQFNQ